MNVESVIELITPYIPEIVDENDEVDQAEVELSKIEEKNSWSLCEADKP